ncbi:MAG: hypothetical protein P8X68_21800, partial [Desulfobacterales bacterium]
FMDMTPVTKDVPALTREEVEKMINACPLTKFKAAIMVPPPDKNGPRLAGRWTHGEVVYFED